MSQSALRRTLLGVAGVGALTLALQADYLTAAGSSAPKAATRASRPMAALAQATIEKPPASAATPVAAATARRELLNTYCVSCHNTKLKTAGLVLESIDADQVGANAELWEEPRKVERGQMPPVGRARPDKDTVSQFSHQLVARSTRLPRPRPIPAGPRCTG